jgi:sugar diacid utilization regulator
VVVDAAPAIERSKFQRKLLAARTVTEAAYVAAEHARRLLDSDLAWVGVREDSIMYMAGSSGLRTAEMMSAWKLELGLGIGGQAIAEGRALADPDYDYQDDPLLEYPKRARLLNQEGVVGVAAAPLLASEETFGVLYVGQRQVRYFERAELSELEFIADCLTTTVAKLKSSEMDQETIRRLSEDLREKEDVVYQTRVLLETATQTENPERVMEVVAHRLQVRLDLQDDAGRVLTSVSGIAGEISPWELWAVETSPLQTGRLVFYGRRAFTRAEMTLAKTVVNVIDLQLMRKSASLAAEMRLSNRFFERLLEAEVDERSLTMDAALLGARIEGPLRALVVRGVGQTVPASSSSMGAVRDAIRRYFPDSLALSYRGDIIGLLPVAQHSSKQILDYVGSELLPGIRSMQYRAVLGPKVYSLGELSGSYYRALLTLDLPTGYEPERPAVLYDRTLDAFPADATRETIQRHVNSVLGSLADRDGKGGGDNVKTLIAYFAEDRHLKRTAERLHVHLNTVRYRIERIEEILEISFRDPDQRFRVEWAVRLQDRLTRTQ